MIAVTTIALTILMSACVLDVVVNKLNPTPKMKGRRISFPEQYAKLERCMSM